MEKERNKNKMADLSGIENAEDSEPFFGLEGHGAAAVLAAQAGRRRRRAPVGGVGARERRRRRRRGRRRTAVEAGAGAGAAAAVGGTRVGADAAAARVAQVLERYVVRMDEARLVALDHQPGVLFFTHKKPNQNGISWSVIKRSKGWS